MIFEFDRSFISLLLRWMLKCEIFALKLRQENFIVPWFDFLKHSGNNVYNLGCSFVTLFFCVFRLSLETGTNYFLILH
jgi:hypothetical protein